jgi:uncharacterized protein DUF1214
LNTYKLRLPPNPPAALVWAVTAYYITAGTMVEAPQLMPSINGFNKVSTNGDGSIDLMVWTAEARRAAIELDPDSRRAEFFGGLASLRHRCRIF